MELQGQLPSDWSAFLLLHSINLIKGVASGFIGLLIFLVIGVVIFDAIAAIIAIIATTTISSIKVKPSWGFPKRLLQAVGETTQACCLIIFSIFRTIELD